MVIFQPLLGNLAEAEAVEDLVLEQEILVHATGAKDGVLGGHDARAELFLVAAEEELEELGDGLGVLLDLLLGVRVEDGKSGVDVPFVCVDTQRDVDLDVLDAAYVPRVLPGELVVGHPGGAHAEEGGVRDGLRVCGDTVVLLAGQVDVLGPQA